MPNTLTELLVSFEKHYDDWARGEIARKDESEAISQIVNGLDVLGKHYAECADILGDLADRSVAGVSCCIETVQESQIQGTELFTKGKFSSAAQNFTRALAFLDESNPDHKPLTARLYRSRALCLIRLGHYSHAVEDCNLALQYHPADDAAHFRKAIALQKLGSLLEALQCASRALDISRSSGAHDIGRDAAHLAHHLREQISSATTAESLPPQPKSSDSDIDGAAAALEVKQTPAEGRALALTEHQGATAGALLLTEKPLVTTVCKARRKQLCHYCLEALPQHAGVTCKVCPMAWYCCAAHRDLDSHHVPGGQACGVSWPALLPEQLVLATRLAAVCQGKGSDTVKHLQTHILDIPRRQQFQEAVMCCVAASCAGVKPRAVLRAYRQVVINAIAITPPEHCSAEDRWGLAVYPRAAMLNHACGPNVAACFKGSRLLIRAVADLPAGTTLRLCYGPQAGESVRAVRQQQLLEQYHFVCRCSACEAADSAAKDAALVGLKCSCCSGPVMPSVECPAGLCSLQELPSKLPESGVCHGCGAKMAAAEQADRLASLSTAGAAYDEACALLAHDRPATAEALRLLQLCLEVQEGVLAPSNQVLGRTHDAVARAHAEHGDADVARLHASKALQIVTAAYGDGSLVASSQRRRLDWLLAS